MRDGSRPVVLLDQKTGKREVIKMLDDKVLGQLKEMSDQTQIDFEKFKEIATRALTDLQPVLQRHENAPVSQIECVEALLMCMIQAFLSYHATSKDDSALREAERTISYMVEASKKLIKDQANS